MTDLNLTAAIEAAEDAAQAHVFADQTTCTCGYGPPDEAAWKRHHRMVAVEAAAPLIRADERAKVAQELRELADREERPTRYADGTEYRVASGYAITLRAIADRIAREHATEVTL